jgi:hypothetical protein
MIQRIRHSVGLNEQGGGNPAVLEQRFARGVNTEQRPVQYRVPFERLTMAAMGDQAAANIDPAFTGCTNDTQLSFFMGKLSLSWALRGFVSGVAIGAIGVAVGLYFLPRRS